MSAMYKPMYRSRFFKGCDRSGFLRSPFDLRGVSVVLVVPVPFIEFSLTRLRMCQWGGLLVAFHTLTLSRVISCLRCTNRRPTACICSLMR